jgi:formate C-acetyltransferase
MDYEDGLPKYSNFGVHGVGVSSAADSLTAIARYVFGDSSISPECLVRAVDSDFSGEEELLHKLRYETPKVGSDEDEPDDFLCLFLDSFADALEGHKNDCGGIWRAGTGSAMYYLWHAAALGASPDGRRTGEPFAANYSVSLFARPNGPFSLIRSMSKPDLSRVINGGPVTLEFHNSIFSTPEAVEQVGQFVKAFIDMGGHQLQLNAVNADTLRDAQAHPEKYPRLIVRIWGWSAYFTELDRAYQDHVIMRQEYLL